VIKLLHRLGLPFGTIHVIAVPGRRSGVLRSTPVSPLTVDGQRYVISGLRDSDWARNARAAGWARLSRGRREEAVRLVEVTSGEESRSVMRTFPRQVPQGVPFFVSLGLVTGPDPDEFAAAADRVAIFRLLPDERNL